MQDDKTPPQPKTAQGFIAGFGITAGLMAVGEFFEHQMQQGSVYSERLGALAKKPAIWFAALAAGFTGAALAQRKAMVADAAEKNSALITMIEEKDAQLVPQCPMPGLPDATEQAIMPPESKYTTRVRQPLPQHSELAKRVDYVDADPVSMER